MAESRSPDAIQREIEATRTELAETIDAIADRVSPKKAASRSAHAVRAKASAALGQAEKAVNGVASRAGDAVASGPPVQHEPPITAEQAERAESGELEPTTPTVLDRTGQTIVNGRPASVLDATPDEASQTDLREPAHLHQQSLRTDRVLVTVGVVAATVGVVVLFRSRHR